MGVFVYVPPLIYDPSNGNLTLQRGTGLTVHLRVQDDTGAFIDISDWSLVFYVDGFAGIPLVAGADDTEQLLIIPKAFTDGVPPRTPLAYLIRDETDSPNVPAAAGFFTAVGLLQALP